MTRRIVDGALVLFVAALVEWDAWSRHAVLGTHIQGPRWVTAALPAFLALPLWWRRRVPLAAALLVLAGVELQALSSRDSAEGLFYVVPWSVAAFAVSAYGSRRASLLALVLLVPGYVVYALGDRSVRHGDAGSDWAASFFGLGLVVAWLLGGYVRSRREAAALTARAARLERETALAVVEERSRIARELHDVIAHGVSVIGLQAGAAERVLASEPERVREPLQAIQAGAREAVFELRRLLGILREGEEPASLAPLPRLAQLDALVEQVERSGLAVDLVVEGDVRPVPPGVELSAFRIAQEALTNVLRHAQASSARVLVRYRPDMLEVEVADDGNGAAAATDGAGHGLIGMRERVAMYGGTLSTGRSESGGFRVHARIPYEAVG
jgi:signal transduction histidine kinase